MCLNHIRLKKERGDLVTGMAEAPTVTDAPVLQSIHGSHPNLSNESRELLQLGYRPDWAGPTGPVEEFDAKLVANAPDIAKPFLKSLNTTGSEWVQEHKPKGMRTEAPGINPSRWG